MTAAGRALLVLALSLVLSVLATATSGAAGAREGDAIVVERPGASSRQSEGGSRTPFSIRLPDGASCRSDSQDGNYRVQSFLVPAIVDPATIVFKSIGPDVDGGFALYDIETRPLVQHLTAEGEAPGGPGRILNIPVFDFAVFPADPNDPNFLEPGRYRMGIACSLFNETKQYWDTELEITTDTEDQPAGLHWQVVGAATAGGDGGWSAMPELAAAAGAAAAALVAVSLTRRSRGRRPTTPPSEVR